mmetsp:Transcript_37421/g.84782  ORF Transcript_37421/g.84782 Transcript_37421/m.84782 type:complete len:256 (-) Transcript_37421:1207-1974(-)
MTRERSVAHAALALAPWSPQSALPCRHRPRPSHRAPRALGAGWLCAAHPSHRPACRTARAPGNSHTACRAVQRRRWNLSRQNRAPRGAPHQCLPRAASMCYPCRTHTRKWRTAARASSRGSAQTRRTMVPRATAGRSAWWAAYCTRNPSCVCLLSSPPSWRLARCLYYGTVQGAPTARPGSPGHGRPKGAPDGGGTHGGSSHSLRPPSSFDRSGRCCSGASRRWGGSSSGDSSSRRPCVRALSHVAARSKPARGH